MFFRKKRPAPSPTLAGDNAVDVLERDPVEASTLDSAADSRVVEDTIPLVEEQVELGKRRVKGDTVRVDLKTDTEIEEVTALLRRESYAVERVRIDEVVDYVPEIRRENGLTVIPVMEERLVTVKQLVLREEIHIREEHDVEDATLSVPVRRQHAEVTRTPREG